MLHQVLDFDYFPRYFDIDVDPCTRYVVQVIASEDYQV